VFGDSLQVGARQIDEDFWFCFVLRKKVLCIIIRMKRAKNLLLEICENVCTSVIRGFHSCC
jgi:hypothetical protein